jgi:hypothetical protein
MATIKKAQAGIKKSVSKMVPGEMTGKMYKKSAIDKIGDKQAKELDKSGVFGKTAMAKKKAQNGDQLRRGQYRRLGRIAERNPERAGRVAERMNTRDSRVSRGKDIASPSMMRSNPMMNMKLSLDEARFKKEMKAGGMLKRADGSYSKRGLWDNIRANKGSGKKPTAAMLKQEKKIKAKTK